MKKIFLIIAMACCYAKSFGQVYPTPVTDTLGYLRYIVTNKQLYIGHPFSMLHNDLAISIKMFRPFNEIHYNKNAETSTSMAFKYAATAEDLYATYPRLVICWQSPYPYVAVSDSLKLLYDRQGIGWNVPLYNRYKDLIVRDIYVHE